jgi:hypothetical protein
MDKYLDHGDGRRRCWGIDGMSRPKPKILLHFTDTKTYRAEQVLYAKAIFAVFLDNQPINLRSLRTLIDESSIKYKKCSFSNPGHAYNLASKLNTMFKTDKFAVHMLIAGPKISETDG